MDATLKSIVLHKSLYLATSGSFQAAQVASLSVLEHAAFLAAFCAALLAAPRSRRTVTALLRTDRRKMYLALALPECAKFVSIVLQIFDQDPSLLLLLAALTASVQLTSFHTLVGSQLSEAQVALALLLAVGARLGVRCCFYSAESVHTLGYIA